MKRKTIFILSVILLVLLPMQIKAFSGSVNISCDKTTLVANEETTCHISGSADDAMVSINLAINHGENLTISDVKKAGDIWQGDDNSTVLDLYTGNDVKGSFSIASFTLKASNVADANTSVSVSNVVYGTRHNGKVSIGNKSLNIAIHTPSSDSSLKSLTVDGKSYKDGSVINNFNASSVTIAAVGNDSRAKVSGDIGTKTLNYGENKFNIVITAENGTSSTYTITINRLDNRSNNTYLKNITVSKGNLNFKKGTTSYTVNVDTDVDSIRIDAIPDDSKAAIEGTGSYKLKLGNNYLKITVVAENGERKVYSIKVNRKDNRSSNTNLKSLSISNGKIDFSSDKTDYELVVDYEVDKFSFSDVVAEDEKATIEGLEEKELVVGLNYLTVKVTAENGDVKKYNFTVIRNKEVKETENNKAKDIVIKNHNFNFDANVNEYVLETRLHELDIKVFVNDPSTTYEITGNENLHDGSIVQITITDSEGNNNIYTIKIYNPSEGKEDESFLDLPIFKIPKYILYIVIFISIIFILILIVLVSKEKENIKKMMNHKSHHSNSDSESSSVDNSGLFGEPTYETLEMAKIDLEDYLSEERKAKRKKGIKESEEDIKNIKNELEEKIAILEEAENTLDEIKKNKEDIVEANGDSANDTPIVDEITIEESVITSLEDVDDSLDEVKPKKTRSGKRAAKRIDLMDIEGLTSEPEIKDDIDDIINASKNEETLESSEEVKPKKTRSSRRKNNEEVSNSKVEESEEKVSETTESSEDSNAKTTTKKKKNKKKKSSSKKTDSKANSKDELLDQILSKNYQKKDK